jgi:predicted transposase YbfD/YdcC
MPHEESARLLDHFAPLEDPRLDRTKHHPLPNLIFIAVCATLCGANDFVAMEKFGHAKRDWLERFLDLSGGIPSHDTFGRVFAALDQEQFLACFTSWVQSVQQLTDGRLIAIDGKTARASLDRAAGKSPLHVVSAWAAENHLVLGQVAVADESNEIPAIPVLLELLELHGAIVTLDAMGCQKEIAAKIRAGGGDYVLAVKGNQEHLHEDILAAFTDLDEHPRRKVSVSETQDKGHGREETRRCEALRVPKGLRHRDEWKDLASICRVIRTYTEGGVSKSEVRYFISSLDPDAEVLGPAVRGHWGIENGLHWVLDLYFGEDRSRARAENAAANLALLRRWVLSLLRQDQTMKGGIEKKRLQAGWDVRNLERLLGLPSEL